MRPGRGHGRQRGQGLTEFALVAPVLLLLICGVFDFGRGMSANVTVTNSAREGARYLAVNASSATSASNWGTACPAGTDTNPTSPSATSAQGKAWRQMQNSSMDMSAVTLTVRFFKASNDPSGGGTADDIITCTYSGGWALNQSSNTYHPAAGDWVQFQVHYAYTPATPFISHIVASVSMDRTTTMVLE